MDSVSQEFIDLMEAQENIRKWQSRNSGTIPEYLINELRKTQRLYEESKISGNTGARHS